MRLNVNTALLAVLLCALALPLVCRRESKRRAEDRARVRAAAGAGDRQRQLSRSSARSDNPGRDARLMAEKLRQLGFEVTEAADRDLKAMTADVEEFSRKVRERGPDTVSVLYYAGHGIENDAVNYLVPVNADIKKRADIAPQSLSVKRVADRLAVVGQSAQHPHHRRMPRQSVSAKRGGHPASLGLVPMGAVYGVFIASSTGSGKVPSTATTATAPIRGRWRRRSRHQAKNSRTSSRAFAARFGCRPASSRSPGNPLRWSSISTSCRRAPPPSPSAAAICGRKGNRQCARSTIS